MLRYCEALEQRLYMSRAVQTGSVLDIYGTTQADQITVEYKTIPVGDATLDGRVTIDDLAVLDASFFFHAVNPGWTAGDFNGDGKVDFQDYNLLNANRANPTTFVTGFVITDGGAKTWYSNAVITHVDVVTIGGGTDSVTGNSQNTDYWVDSSDATNISAGEASHVHSVAAFTQPWTVDSNNPDYIPLQLSGQNLRDPSDTLNPRHYTNATVWGTTGIVAPTAVAQGTTGDCYFLSGLQALSQANPQLLQDHIVDLGDGTYAVDFIRNSIHLYYRVDGDFSYPNAASYSTALWPLIAEKAFAFYRGGNSYGAANTYASLTSGWLPELFNAFNVPTAYFSPGSVGFNYIQSALAANKATTFATLSTIPTGVPLVASHTYTLYSAFVSNGINMVTLRNPWGVDGVFAGVTPDSNPNDGLVTMTYNTLATYSSLGDIATFANTLGNLNFQSDTGLLAEASNATTIADGADAFTPAKPIWQHFNVSLVHVIPIPLMPARLLAANPNVAQRDVV